MFKSFSTKFKLDKTYLDCIDSEGNCFIVYWAKLEYLFLNITYSGLIFSSRNGITKEKSSFRLFPRPVIQDKIKYSNPHTGVSGIWGKLDQSIISLLYSDPQENKILWDCHHPKAQVEITYENKTFSGYGYSETILLPIKPWELPIEELRWGRFLSENVTIVWIEWRYQHPVNKLYYNGTLYEDAIFKENSIGFGQGKYKILMENPIVVREGKLGKIINSTPWLKTFFNSKILQTVEIKYKSKTTFYEDRKTIEHGWSLYEVVKF